MEGHFVGSIVRIDEDFAAGSTIAMIIDGQQRLTTLTLLLLYEIRQGRTDVQRVITVFCIKDRVFIDPSLETGGLVIIGENLEL